IWGFVFLSLLLIPFYYIPAGQLSTLPEHRLEDAIDAFYQMSNNPQLILAVLGNMVSIAFFNFAGISVTKEMSATTRMVLDSVRTLVIWVFTIAVGWESFLPLKILGFVLLLNGQCIYNQIICAPLLRKKGICLRFVDPTGEAGRQPLIIQGDDVDDDDDVHIKHSVNA
uniref:Solute carrier family 35 member F6-like n=1 Tax=Saccoglossus kowalevskii TaxID=10224 RepID=A0ABM0M1P0_SACKO